jgi:hypothetical protein
MKRGFSMKWRFLLNIPGLWVLMMILMWLSWMNPWSSAEFFVIVGGLFAVLAGAYSWLCWNVELSFDASSKNRGKHVQTMLKEMLDEEYVPLEKRKRDTLDNVLRDLSDEQLDTLRRRLHDGVIDDEVLERRIVGADGELIRRN